MGTRQDFNEVMDLVVAGKLKPALDREFPLEDARAAQEYLGQGTQMGKVTLVID
jgi:NADPH:quinone reductase-like Zn-dependent oxidoreductase